MPSCEFVCLAHTRLHVCRAAEKRPLERAELCPLTYMIVKPCLRLNHCRYNRINDCRHVANMFFDVAKSVGDALDFACDSLYHDDISGSHTHQRIPLHSSLENDLTLTLIIYNIIYIYIYIYMYMCTHITSLRLRITAIPLGADWRTQGTAETHTQNCRHRLNGDLA